MKPRPYSFARARINQKDKETAMKRTVFTAAMALIFSALAHAQTQAQAPSQPGAARGNAGQPTLTPDQVAAQRRAQQEQLANDWANLTRYRDANRNLPSASESQPRVVFMGDSITELWDRDSGKFFASKGYVGRGISGQTTPQMLIRFQQDVVALRPKVVVINAGTNDIAGNTGPSTLEMIEDNLTSMTQIAVANGIHVVLASVTPAYDYPWKRGLEPAEKVVSLNSWMQKYCVKAGCVYADYFTPLSDEKHGMKEGLSRDGIHPTPAGYAIMAPIAERAIAQALGKE
jgi:lysophospholipase L1-like esterase